MGVDKETEVNYCNIVIDDNKQYLAQLRKQAEEEGINDENKKQLSISSDQHSFSTEEYYFDEYDNTIVISGEMISDAGKSYVYLAIPLSDVVLIDILQHAIKKLNKLKTAMEALK